ncbi:hypothetical protein V501_02979 [Pseudogymnoascus sp. VKM F-4519 (FW-2642)]|nr:hypothetical protein V501_02979 [Pseudogymnoascus sp. VKM F-4519 (FW-2642)]
MLHQALSARGVLLSKIYRPRHSETQRCLATGQHRAFHIFPRLRYNDHNNSYVMTPGRTRSLSTISPNSNYRVMVPKSNTESEATINGIKSKLQALENKINTETEFRQQDAKFNSFSYDMRSRDISYIYESLSELRSRQNELGSKFYTQKIWQLYSAIIALVAVFIGVLSALSAVDLARSNRELERLYKKKRRENKQREDTLAIEQ